MAALFSLATDKGVVLVRRDGSDWRELGRDLVLERVTCVTAHGGDILVGTTAGIYLSEDIGESWRSASADLTIDHVRWIAYHPEYPSFAYAGTEPAAIFVTRDGAETWQECPEVAALRDEFGWYLPYSPEAGCVRGFAFHGSRGYAAVEQGGLLRSDDRGQTWRLADGSIGDPRASLPEGFVHQDVHSVNIHPSSPDLVFAPTARGLYRSEDGGKLWTLLYRCYCRAVWVDPADPDHLIFGPADGVDRNGRIEESVDGGRNWRPASMGLEVPWSGHMVERLASDGERLLAVLSNGEFLDSSLQVIDWRRILPEIEAVNAVAVIGG
jgi:photosystem II stability/assembly factor-like uncharacterized protein